MKVAVALLAKAPVAGQVKTRLAASVGHRAACFYYKKMCESVAKMAAQTVPSYLTLWYTPTAQPTLGRLARQVGASLRAQPQGDLGQRLCWVAAQELRRAEGVLLIGADAVGLTPAHLQSAVRLLQANSDVVVAPAGDGGYTLIGLRKPTRAVFQQIPWGTARVMGATQRRCRRAGLRLTQLPTATDLDTAHDLKTWLQARGAAL